MIQDFAQMIVDDYRDSAESRIIAERLNRIYRGNIEAEVKLSLAAELNPRAYAKAIKRIPDINTIKKITDKLSRVYTKAAGRSADAPKDGKQIEFYTKALELDRKFAHLNKMENLMKCVAVEPFLDQEGKPTLRILLPFQFRALSTDPSDPLSVDIFVKFLPSIKTKTPDGVTETIEVLECWSAEEKMLLHLKKDGHLIASVETHDIKRIPALYISRDEQTLNPPCEEHEINSGVLIAKAYADLYFAVQYTTHSVTIARDVVFPDKADYSPDSVVNVATADVPNPHPSIEVIVPKADIGAIRDLIRDTLFFMLDSKGIKPREAETSVERPNATYEIIEQADASATVAEHCVHYTVVERKFWDLIKHMHSIWMLNSAAKLEDRSKFSDKFVVTVAFNEIKAVEVGSAVLDRVQKQIDMGLMSPKQALREIYPYFTDAKLDAWLKEIEEHREKQRNEISKDPNTGTPDGGTESGLRGGRNPTDPGADGGR